MSINLTQEFTFESDELKSVAAVFGAVARILYSFSGSYRRPFVIVQQPEYYHWDDGRYEIPLDPDPSIYEHRDGVSVVEPCATYHGATVLGEIERHGTKESAARSAVAMRGKYIPTRKWIATVTTGTPSKEAVVKHPRGWDHLTELLIESAMGVNSDLFREEFREARSRQYGNFDGSIDMGYRLQYSHDCHNTINFSAVHILYGK